MPAGVGGMGLQSSLLTSHIAYWASWADSLSNLVKSIPGFVDVFMPATMQLAANEQARPTHTCLSNLHKAVKILQAEGLSTIPSWQSLLEDLNPST